MVCVVINDAFVVVSENVSGEGTLGLGLTVKEPHYPQATPKR
jgi:hypothetical protein